MQNEGVVLSCLHGSYQGTQRGKEAGNFNFAPCRSLWVEKADRKNHVCRLPFGYIFS